MADQIAIALCGLITELIAGAEMVMEEDAMSKCALFLYLAAQPQPIAIVYRSLV